MPLPALAMYAVPFGVVKGFMLNCLLGSFHLFVHLIESHYIQVLKVSDVKLSFNCKYLETVCPNAQ